MIIPKEQALQLRRRGISIRDIEQRLGIARSTLSYWFRDIILPKKYQDRLQKKWEHGLMNARKKAVQWHRSQKELRIKDALAKAEESLGKIDTNDPSILELALAMLYLGEGFKKNGTGLGNSNVVILKFFLAAIEKIYDVHRASFRYELHLRADQNPKDAIGFWSKNLGVSKGRFARPILDPRTQGRPTYSDYHGVCSVQCGNVAIQRKLVYISDLFCLKITQGV